MSAGPALFEPLILLVNCIVFTSNLIHEVFFPVTSLRACLKKKSKLLTYTSNFSLTCVKIFPLINELCIYLDYLHLIFNVFDELKHVSVAHANKSVSKRMNKRIKKGGKCFFSAL